MNFSPRRLSGFFALVALIAAVGVLSTGSLAFADAGHGGGGSGSAGGTSVVTQADCDAGRIRNKQGETLRGEACERLIGQRVNLAQTGFEAWMLLLGGVALMGGAVVLRVRRSPSASPQLT